MTDGPLLHEEVQQNADLVAPRFEKLVYQSIVAIAKSI